ncbi:DUF5908 family protein [Persicobacter diffluens]|uniref:Uncharacterized protein n=1 Tax=Persicobacter diffluens TaxID=981 RepID=A0AAN4W168_9BACT|nr:hypothetical protein PEDI_39950 [Persicobacter diffluens]
MIEIKELNVSVRFGDSGAKEQKTEGAPKMAPIHDIVNACTKKVIRELKKNQNR